MARDQLADQVAQLAERVAQIEHRLEPRGVRADEAPLWALEAIRPLTGGRIVFAGALDTPERQRFEWQEQHDPAALLAADWTRVAGTLAALGHPVRLAVLRAVLEGRHTARELGELPGLGTSGQTYHHLRELQAAGWVRQARRNHYVVPGDRIVPLLVALAAAGLSGEESP